jgi:hypothetical protein
MFPAVEVEIKEIEKAKDGLEEAIAKLRKAFKRMNKGDEDSDLFLFAINMLENIRGDYLDAWLEEFQSTFQEDSRKLESWKRWATYRESSEREEAISAKDTR